MAVKQHSVQSTFQLGQIDETFSQRHDLNIPSQGVKTMDNWLPTGAGTAKRRPALKLENSSFLATMKNIYAAVPMRMLDGTVSTILFIQNASTATSMDINQVEADGSVIAEGTITLVDGIRDWVQAGTSLFFTLKGGSNATDGIGRLINTTATVCTLETDSDFTWWRELQGLWTIASGDDTNLFSPVDTGPIGPDESLATAPATALKLGDDITPTATGNPVYNTTPNPDTYDITLTSSFGGPYFADSPVYRQLNGDDALIGGVESRRWRPLPYCVTFFKQRLVLANIHDTNAGAPGPTRVLMSETNNIFNIIPGSLRDDSAIDMDVFLPGVNEFIWAEAFQDTLILASRQNLVTVKTRGGVTPTTIGYDIGHDRGGDDERWPVRDDNKLYYVASGKANIYQLIYDDASQSFRSQDITRLVPRIFRDNGTSSTLTVDKIAIKQPSVDDPVKRVMALRSDGVLIVGSEIDESVPAWATITAPTGYTFSEVVSLGEALHVFLEETSTGNGSLVHLDFNSWENDFVVDFEETQTGASTASYTATHPALQSVEIFVISEEADNEWTELVTTDGSGNFTLSAPTTTIRYGIAFDGDLELFSPVVGDEQGSSQLRKSNNVRNLVRVKDTRALVVNGVQLFSTVPTTAGELTNAKNEAQVTHKLGWKREHNIVLSGQAGYNAHILCINRELVV